MRSVIVTCYDLRRRARAVARFGHEHPDRPFVTDIALKKVDRGQHNPACASCRCGLLYARISPPPISDINCLPTCNGTACRKILMSKLTGNALRRVGGHKREIARPGDGKTFKRRRLSTAIPR